MNGILVIDKPADWTSHDVVAKLRGALKIKRIGHGGTLDPMATGVLPIFIGKATRAAEYLENADKEYVAGLRLGLVTDTHDITGNTLSISEISVSTDDLLATLPRFLGAQKQIPPMYSAIKIGGKKLYELARRGVEVERPARDINISNIELLGGNGAEFKLKISCSKGTYIRTLCHDIGEALGCGGVMSSLRRTKAGIFSINEAHELDQVLKAAESADVTKHMLMIDKVFSMYPAITLGEAETRKCINGAPFNLTGATDGIYRFYNHENEFMMLGKITFGTVKGLKSFF